MKYVKQAVAVTIGLLVFVGAPILMLKPVISLWSHALFKTTDFSETKQPRRFTVALYVPAKEQGIPAKYEYTYLRMLAERSGKDDGYTYLLPEPEARIPSTGDGISFEVLEDSGEYQIIEVMYMNTHTSWSRYKAYADKIEPLSYRIDGSFLVLIPILLVLMTAAVAGNTVTKRLYNYFGVTKINATTQSA